MAEQVLVFDMDGVLVDVSDSYRACVQRTVRHFTGREITREAIQDYKNAGGWNNDWDLCHHLIAGAGVAVTYEQVVEQFNVFFLGKDGRPDALIYRERWVAKPGLLERLAARFDFALFSGRVWEEMEITLARFCRALRFDPIMTADRVEFQKPAPEGLLRIAEAHRGKRMWYVGDTIDDARAAWAAGVPFIGIAAPSNPRAGELAARLAGEGALAVLGDINELEKVLPE